MMGVGGMGGGNPDGAQITYVRLKNGAMKNVAETEQLVARWRDLLTTIGLAAFPHVLERDQLLLNTQEGWRVPDMKEFALQQPEVKYVFQQPLRNTQTLRATLIALFCSDLVLTSISVQVFRAQQQEILCRGCRSRRA